MNMSSSKVNKKDDDDTEVPTGPTRATTMMATNEPNTSRRAESEAKLEEDESELDWKDPRTYHRVLPNVASTNNNDETEVPSMIEPLCEPSCSLVAFKDQGQTFYVDDNNNNANNEISKAQPQRGTIFNTQIPIASAVPVTDLDETFVSPSLSHNPNIANDYPTAVSSDWPARRPFGLREKFYGLLVFGTIVVVSVTVGMVVATTNNSDNNDPSPNTVTEDVTIGFPPGTLPTNAPTLSQAPPIPTISTPTAPNQVSPNVLLPLRVLPH